MTANELADVLENDDRLWFVDEDLMVKTCAMLRQQQAEIESLKKEAALQRLSDFTQEADNEPVAWTVCLDCGQRVTGDSIHTCSPQLKTLTDEEINQVAIDMGMFGDLSHDENELCRNVLRKAQEK